jgi:hypothetical protein
MGLAKNGNIMSEFGIIIGIVAFVVIAPIGIFRSLKNPQRRNRIVEDLLESMAEPELDEDAEDTLHRADRLDGSPVSSAFASP